MAGSTAGPPSIESCRIVYLCAGAEKSIQEHYGHDQPPRVPCDKKGALAHTYKNVYALLDEDQGGFDEGVQDHVASTVALLC